MIKLWRKKMDTSQLFWYIIPFCKSIHKTNPYTNVKQNIHTQTNEETFRRISLPSIPPVKKAHRARTCWYSRTFRLIYRYQIKRGKKGMDGNNNNNIKVMIKCIMANISAIRQQAVHTTYQLSSPSCLTRALQKRKKKKRKKKKRKSLTLTTIVWESSGEKRKRKVRRMDC